MQSEAVTLQVYVWSDEESYVRAVAEAYNASHASARVVVNALNSTNYESLIEPLLTDSDTQIDLLGIRGISKVVQLADENLLLDITAPLTDSISDGRLDGSAYGNMFNDITYQGRYYAIPARTTCWALYYNKTLFDQAGLPYPEQLTWEEYAALAQSLTDRSAGIYGGYLLPWLPGFMALQTGCYLIDDDLTPMRRSLEFMNELYQTSHVSYYEMEELQTPPEDAYGSFEAGTVAMVPNGEWMLNILLRDEAAGLTSVDWDIAPMPVSPGLETNTTWGQYQFIGITSSTAYPEEAFDFLSYLCGEDGAAIYARQAIIPAYTDDQIVSAYLEAAGHSSAAYFFEAKKVQEQLPLPGYQETTEAFRDAAEAYFSGNRTLDEAMDDFSSQRARIFGARQ